MNAVAIVLGNKSEYTWQQVVGFFTRLGETHDFSKLHEPIQIGSDANIHNILAFAFACFSGIDIKMVGTADYNASDIWFASIFTDVTQKLSETDAKINYTIKTNYSKNTRQNISLETSGSTGTSKLVVHEVRSLEYQAMSVCKNLNLIANDRQLAYMPLNYIYGLSVIYSWMYSGSSLVVTNFSPNNGTKFFNELIDANITVFSGVPYTYLLMQRWGFQHLKGSLVHSLTQAGGYLPKNVKDCISHELPEVHLVIMYGQTEFCGRIAQGRYDPSFSEQYVGRLLEGIHAIVSDEDEIFIHSPSLCSNPNVLMDQMLVDGREYYSTGDIGEIYGDIIYISGRNQHFLKVGGRRIPYIKIYSLLEENTSIQSVFITSGIARAEKILIGVVPFVSPSENSVQGFVRELQNNLKHDLKLLLDNVGYQFYVLNGELPLLANGKINQLQITQALKEAYARKESFHIWL